MPHVPDVSRRPVYEGKELSNTPGMPSTPPSMPSGKAPNEQPRSVQNFSDAMSRREEEDN